MDSQVGGSGTFGFAFNDPNFSDRILSIEIIPDGVDTELPAQNRKRSRDGGIVIKQENGEGTSMHREEQSVKCIKQDVEDIIPSVKKGKDGDEMIQESSSGDEANRSSRSREFLSVLRVNTIHVSSAILAGQSPFFHQLFVTGTEESGRQGVATLRIHAFEESTLMELLKFMYNHTLSTTTPSELLDILMMADKFEVDSCMQYCSQRLITLPMTMESALSCLNLPSRVRNAEGLQLLTDSVKQFIAFQFRSVDKLEDQVLNLPLAGMEAVLSRDDIPVESEDAVYDIVLRWAEFNYPRLEERREVLDTRLRFLIRFPYMSSEKLKKLLIGTDFSRGVVSGVLLEALFFKNDPLYKQRRFTKGRQLAPELVNTFRHYMERAYTCRPVKTIEIQQPRRRSESYLDLKWEECVRLFPDGKIYSQTFHLGRRFFFPIGSVQHRP